MRNHLKKLNRFSASVYGALPFLLFISCAIEKPFKPEKVKEISNSYLNTTYYPAVRLDTLNRFDTNGYKHGYWIQFEDANGYPTDDTSKRTYYSYTYFNKGGVLGPNGPSVYPYIAYPARQNAKRTPTSKLTEHDSCKARTGALTMLNGRCVYTNKRHKIKMVVDYKNGFPECATRYNKGKVCETDEFTIKHNNTFQTTLLTYFDKKGNIESQLYICNSENHFQFYPVIDNGKRVNNDSLSKVYHSARTFRHDSILYYKKGWAYVYTQNNIEINYKQLFELCKLDTNTHKEVTKAKTFYYTGLAFGEIGVGTILFGAESNYANKTNYVAPFYLGWASIILGGPFGIAFQHHIKKAVDIYNKGVPYKRNN